MKKNRTIWGGILFAGALLAVLGYYLVPGGKVATMSRPKVAATIFPLYDMVRNVAGEDADVVLVAPRGASPHTFEVGVGLIRNLQGVKTFFAIGYGLDDWIATAHNAVPDSEVALVSDGVKLRVYNEQESSDEAGNVDPHYWLTIPNAEIITKNIAAKLSSLDPRHAAAYKENASRYLAELGRADAEIRGSLATVKGAPLFTMHDAWFYFAKEYGLKVVAAFEPFPGREPTQKYLIELAQKIKAYGIKVIFSEPQLSSASLQSFLQDYRVNLLVLDPEGSAENDSYINLMRYNAKTVYEAFRQ